MTHHFHVETTAEGFRWVCVACKATGNVQDSHQLALEHGMQHLRIEAGEIK